MTCARVGIGKYEYTLGKKKASSGELATAEDILKRSGMERREDADAAREGLSLVFTTTVFAS
jgi:hypothetical protein